MCYDPFFHKEQNMHFKCGKCYDCRMERIRQWAFRLCKEAERSSSAFFITLTLAPKHIQRSPNGFKTLDKRQLQLYWKRLRKTQKTKIKYYAVGEYGTQNKRPHYHAIVYNVEDVEQINKCWQLGYVYIDAVNTNTTAYVAKYCMKSNWIKKHKNDDRLPEFSVMSNDIGTNYLTEAVKKWHTENGQDAYYIPLLGGQKVSIPKSFKEKLYTKEEREHIGDTLIRRAINKDIHKRKFMTPQEEYEYNRKLDSTIALKSQKNNGDKRKL